MPSLAERDKAEKHADSAFCPAIFPWRCSQLGLKQWTAGKEALNLSSSLEHHEASLLIKLIFTQHTRGAQFGLNDNLG